MKQMFVAVALTCATASGALAQQGTVNLAYVEWSDATVATNLLAGALEEKGFTVNMVPLPAAAMWQAVATGEADAMVAAWLPVSHAAYHEALKDQVDLAGVNLEGAKLGWAVPTYMDISSIEDLRENPGIVNGQIIGIDSGAGLMQASERAISGYGLDVTLVDGSDATMTAALQDAINREEPIVVTAWTPHWMFSRFDLKYLDDPEGIFGADETVYNVTRKGLQEDMPEAFDVIANFKISVADEEALMAENEEGGDPAATARAWLEANPDKVAEWTAH